MLNLTLFPEIHVFRIQSDIGSEKMGVSALLLLFFKIAESLEGGL